jgi:ubiquinone/menaquinone biosynthesis C-methylase UbiE
MTIYNSIGNNYNETRQADERILSPILSLLKCPPCSLIADIGAGTGNYSYEFAKMNYIVHALEPSEKMQLQRKNHDNLIWFYGYAEDLPFDDDSYDGVICTMATHHFSSLETAYQEMHRILKKNGSLVVFTADPRMADVTCWLKNYFSPHYKFACDIQPECKYIIDLVESIFCTKAAITQFPLPHNLTDRFFYSAWRYPEKYLNSNFRNGISCFALVDKITTDNAIHRLESDLKNGKWDDKYGFYRNRDVYNGGYYFLSMTK